MTFELAKCPLSQKTWYVESEKWNFLAKAENLILNGVRAINFSIFALHRRENKSTRDVSIEFEFFPRNFFFSHFTPFCCDN